MKQFEVTRLIIVETPFICTKIYATQLNSCGCFPSFADKRSWQLSHLANIYT